jgi:methyl-accepting chemotaxis protein
MLENKKIKTKLIITFGTVIAMFIVLSAVSVTGIKSLQSSVKNIDELRIPTAFASTRMTNDINSSLANLRGYMITGNDKFKQKRAHDWTDIDKAKTIQLELSKNWTNSSNVKQLEDFMLILEEFRVAQQLVEDTAHSSNEQPAKEILYTKAAPLGAQQIELITKIINEEFTLEATPERKNLLGIMADVRGSFAMSLASIRAYLLSGDKKFTDAFNKSWAVNEKRFNDLKNNISILSVNQKVNLNKFSNARSAFSPLPPEMFAIRDSDKWNMASYYLVSEAAPRAGKLMGILFGEVGEDGKRSEGMVENQKRLLTNDVESINEHVTMQEIWLVVLLLIGLAVAGASIFVITNALSLPIAGLVVQMSNISDKQYNFTVERTDQVDEIGDIARAVSLFRDNAKEADKLVEAQKKEDKVKLQRAERVEELVREFDTKSSATVATVASAATELSQSSESMSSVIAVANSKAGNVSTTSGETSSNVQTVASAAEELSASVGEIAEQLTKTTAVVNESVEKAESADVTANELSEAAVRIGTVVDLIRGIAEQINLLALNATIESARAGEAGRGFAVVAIEVKNLAGQASSAVEEIDKEVSSVQDVAANVVSVLQSIKEGVNNINEYTNNVSAAVEEQSSVTNEISSNMQVASVGVDSIVENVNGVTESIQTADHTAAEVLVAAQELSKQSESLSSDIQRFITDIKAA